MILLWMILLTIVRKSESLISPIETILRTYKSSTLKFREDIYQGNLPIYPSYDYIVVGAGPAGCAVANRLSEDPKTTVLLLEDGPEPTFPNEVPIFHLLLFNTDYNWNFTSEYNPNVCRSMIGGVCPWPSGRGIGGGSAINAMIYSRGNKRDFDSWGLEGNSGWSYNDLLPYFRNQEDILINQLRNSPFRGQNGNVPVTYPVFKMKGVDTFLAAASELGYPEIDYNAPYMTGVARIQMNIKNGMRWPGGKAYLEPIKTRKNLHVVQKAKVTKVIIDPLSKTAVGVEFIKKSNLRLVTAFKEIILSAGAFGSPKILMLSGIGPAHHLSALGIPVIQDLPVGNNLQEHIGFTGQVFIGNSSDFSIYADNFFLDLPKHFVEYQSQHTGRFTNPGVEGIAYVRSKYAKGNEGDIELLFVGGSYNDDYGNQYRKTVGITDEVYNSYWKPLEKYAGRGTFSIYVMGCYPKSRGTVRLASRNPLEPIIINNNFLDDPEDLAVLVEGLKISVELAKTKAMKNSGVTVYEKNIPGCEDLVFGSDEYWECAVRQITAQFHHQCGTCKMGPPEDPTSVVDSRLRVKGISNLRVVDSSIMPLIPAGHTMAPSFTIGEKGAALIKEDNEKQY